LKEVSKTAFLGTITIVFTQKKYTVPQIYALFQIGLSSSPSTLWCPQSLKLKWVL